MEACEEGNVAKVEKLLVHKRNLEEKTSTGDTALLFAAVSGSVEIARMLINAGAKITAHNRYGLNMLHVAAAYGKCDMIRFILDSKFFDVNCPGRLGEKVIKECHEVYFEYVKEGPAPLHLSARNGHVKAAKLLLEYGANINATDINGESPLIYAACKQDAAMVDFLISQGADLNQADKRGWAAAARGLMAMSISPCNSDYKEKIAKSKSTFEALRKAGAIMGDDVLCAASSKGSATRGLLKELLESHTYGQDALNKALVFACYCHEAYFKPQKTIQLLMQHGAMPADKVKDRPYNALQVSVIVFSIKNLQQLVNAGANLNVMDSSSNSLLNFAAFVSDLRMLKFLVSEYHLPCNEANAEGNTPLLSAIEVRQNASMIEYLLANGSDVNHQNRTGQTALHLACKENRKDLVKIFLAYGADTKIKDNNGRIPGELTTNESILELLNN